MTRYPRINVCGHDTSWTTANRPLNPDHGLIGYNETTHSLGAYDAATKTWYIYANDTTNAC